MKITRPLLLLLCFTACGPQLEGDALDQTEQDATALRPEAKGLMSRDYSSRSPGPTFAKIMQDTVVQIGWSSIESSSADGLSSGGYAAPGTGGWAELDDALARGFRVRLRILAGPTAPDYVKRIGGQPPSSAAVCPNGGIGVYDAHDGKSSCIPQYWRARVIDRYEALMQEVARRYAANPNLREVVDSACMTTYAEPFYRSHGDTESYARLIDAGLTLERDIYCHQRAVQIHAQVFPTIRMSLAVNAWDQVAPDTTRLVRTNFQATYDFLEGTGSITRVYDWAGNPTAAVWPGARAVLGLRLVLQNNGTGEESGCDSETDASVQQSHFCYLKRIARTTQHSVGFQTRTMPRLRSDCDGCAFVRTEQEGVRLAVDVALGLGANFVEMPGGFEDWRAQSDIDLLASLDRRLEANAP